MQPLGQMPTTKLKLKLGGYAPRRSKLGLGREETGNATPLVETEAEASDTDGPITPTVEATRVEQTTEQISDDAVRLEPDDTLVDVFENDVNGEEDSISPMITKSTTPPYDPPTYSTFSAMSTPRSFHSGTTKRRLSNEEMEVAFDVALSKFKALDDARSRKLAEMLTQIREQRHQQPHTNDVIEDVLLQRQSGESHEQWVALLESAKAEVSAARRSRRHAAKTRKLGDSVNTSPSHADNEGGGNNKDRHCAHAMTPIVNHALAKSSLHAKSTRSSTSSSTKITLRLHPTSLPSPSSASSSFKSSPTSQMQENKLPQPASEDMMRTRSSSRRTSAAAVSTPATTSARRKKAADSNTGAPAAGEQSSSSRKPLAKTASSSSLSSSPRDAPATSQPAELSIQNTKQRPKRHPAPSWKKLGSTSPASAAREPQCLQDKSPTVAADPTFADFMATGAEHVGAATDKFDSDEPLSDVDEGIIQNGDQNRQLSAGTVAKELTGAGIKNSNNKRSAESAGLPVGHKNKNKRHSAAAALNTESRFAQTEDQITNERSIIDRHQANLKEQFATVEGRRSRHTGKGHSSLVYSENTRSRTPFAEALRSSYREEDAHDKSAARKGSRTTRMTISVNGMSADQNPFAGAGTWPPTTLSDSPPPENARKRRRGTYNDADDEIAIETSKKAKRADTRSALTGPPLTPPSPKIGLKSKSSPNKATWQGKQHPAGVRATRTANIDNTRVSLGVDNLPVGEDGYMETCLACGQDGELVVCDNCPRAFHYVCCAIPLDPRDPEIESKAFFCELCKAPPASSFEDPLFDSFDEAIEYTNPLVYALPKSVKNLFEGVYEAPGGEYRHHSDRLVSTKEKKKTATTTRAKKQTEANAGSEADEAAEEDPLATVEFCSYCGLSNYNADTMEVDNSGIRCIIPCDFEGCNEKLHAYHKFQGFIRAEQPTKDFRYAQFCNKHLGYTIELTRNPGRMTEEVIDEALDIVKVVAWHPLRVRKRAKELRVDQGNRNMRNNGIIDVELDEDAAEEFQTVYQPDGLRLKIPEKFITMDFIAKAKRTRYEETKKAEFDMKIKTECDLAVEERIRQMYPDFETALNKRVKEMKTAMQKKVDADWKLKIEQRYAQVEDEMNLVFQGELEKDQRFTDAVEDRVATEVPRRLADSYQAIDSFCRIEDQDEQAAIRALTDLRAGMVHKSKGAILPDVNEGVASEVASGVDQTPTATTFNDE